MEGGPQCVRLVTTRNDQVLPEEAMRIRVDAMESEEAVTLLCRGLPDEAQQARDQPVLETLARRLGYWPILLTLAHGLLVAQVRRQRTLALALALIEQAYEVRGVLAFDLGDATDRQRAVKACIEVSLHHLEEWTSPRYQAIQRYQELAVFPENTDIPLETLRHYWQGTGGLAAWEVDDLCIDLYDLSLLLACDLNTNTIRLHGVMCSYLAQRVGTDLPALHTRFLDVSKLVLGLKRWANLPADERYLWQHLILHLCSASHAEELQTTLTDLWYLTRKALYVGVAALEADLLLASTFKQVSAAGSVQPFFASLHRTIARLSYLLRQIHTPAEIGGLLLSHLRSQPHFATQRPVFWCELPRPFLTVWHPLLSRLPSALFRILQGHTGSLNGCAVSPDGRFIVSASDDETLKVWDAATGAERLTLKGHTDRVSGCAVSPDGSFIVSASYDKTLKVWDVATGAERFTLKGHARYVINCAVSPDSRFIVSASWDGTLKVWDVAAEVQRHTLTGNTLAVSSCAVSPDGTFIVSASWDGMLKVWDTATGAERLSFKGHYSKIIGCAVSPDGTFIVSASRDHIFKVWDAATGTERLTLTGHTDRVSDCVVSPDGTFIVSASDDKTLKIWDAATGAERLSLKGHRRAVTSCAVSPDGRFIVSASWDGTLKVWDATTGAEHLSLKGHAAEEQPLFFAGHTLAVSDCAVSSDGSFIVSASADTTLKVWDATTGAERLSLTGHTSEVTSCAVSPDDRFIISASDDWTLKVWDAQTGQCMLTFPVDGPLSDSAFLPNGEHLVTCGTQGMYFLRLVV